MRLTGLGCAVVVLCTLVPSSFVAQAAERWGGAAWPVIGGSDKAQFYSPLSQINSSNVSRLKLQWYSDIPTSGGLMGNALVKDGVVYESGIWGRVWANDLRTGRLLWEFRPRIHFDGSVIEGLGGIVNRGVALWGRFVYVATPDCRVIAVDRSTGKEAWASKACGAGLTISEAPRAGGGKVFVGTVNMDLESPGVSGYLEAFDGTTGKRLWRFYSIPRDPSKGYRDPGVAAAARTWGRDWWKRVSGGSVWGGITYDPELNLVYFGTDGAQPENPKKRGVGAGSELFTNSIVALNAGTGALAWYYQTTPHDPWDYNADMPIVIATLRIGGRARRVVMQAPKNGFFYVLDARTGKLLRAKNYVPVNWAARIDLKTGRPVELPGAQYYEHPGESVVVEPGVYGAHNWQAMSYSPRTGLVYLPASLVPTIFKVTSSFSSIGGDVSMDWRSLLCDPRYKGKAGRLVAWDPIRGRAKWTQPLRYFTNGGVLSTAGNLVFEGTASGRFIAYDATTGRELWAFATGSSIQAAPTTVKLGGRQLVLIPVGIGGGVGKLSPEFLGDEGNGPDRLLAFSLDGSAHLPRTSPEPPFQRPPRPRPESAALVARGRALFANIGCEDCHGPDAHRQPGPDEVADLRRLSAKQHDEFAAIVCGLEEEKGMPNFASEVTGGDLQALQAFILNEAWDAYDGQQRHTGQQRGMGGAEKSSASIRY